MKQQTAVEWLAEITSKLGYVSADILEQAKAMEKEQHRRTYVDSTSQFENEAYMPHVKPFEQYYNETYGGDK